jgi:hypothetical protein
MERLSKPFYIRITPGLYLALQEEAERLRLRVSDLARWALARACDSQDRDDTEVSQNARTR